MSNIEANLGVSNVDHVPINVEIHLGARLELTLQAGGALLEKVIGRCSDNDAV